MKNLRPIPNVFPLQPFVKTAFGFDWETLVWETASKTTEIYTPLSLKSLENSEHPLDSIIEQQRIDNVNITQLKANNRWICVIRDY
ncbi:MAG: hypothetical protein ACPIA1_01865 [Flavobacteriaceae bacterium]